MTVKIDGDTPRGYSDTYWRDKVFDTYTGHGWQSSTEFRPRHTTLIGKSENGKVVWKYSRLLDHPPASGRELRQTFRLGPMAGNSIYAAGEVAEILSTSRPLHQDDFNCWQGVSRHRGWTGYSVVSELPVIAPRKLRVAGKLYPQEVRIHGTQVITTTARVGDLAKKITKGLNTPYEKALAIERYLGQHYTYDLDAPAAPAGMDAVNYFLFTSERGYCDVFASAMVVMCREIGVPARLATGFSTGVYDPSRKCYLVRDMDRHAWAEVYFPDCGWVTFDPTSWTQDSSGDWLGDFGKTVQRTLDDLFGGPASMPMVIALLAVCAAIAFSPELKRIGFRRRPHGPSKLHEAAVSQYKAIRKSIRASEKHLTPLEAAASSETLPQEARTAAKRSAELFGEIRYGKRDVTTADIRELARLHGAIKAAARRTPVTTRDERRLPE
jgi:hypothetical protein